MPGLVPPSFLFTLLGAVFLFRVLGAPEEKSKEDGEKKTRCMTPFGGMLDSLDVYAF